MKEKKKLTNNADAFVADSQNVMTAGPRGPMLLQDAGFLEKSAHFDREVIPERRIRAKGSGACGTFAVTHDITRCIKARIFSEVGKKTELFTRFSAVAGERGAALRSDWVKENQGAESALAFHLSLAEMRYAEHPLGSTL